MLFLLLDRVGSVYQETNCDFVVIINMDYAYGQSNEYPLRILVPSDSVGAIIGKQGATIKQIKQNSHAR